MHWFIKRDARGTAETYWRVRVIAQARWSERYLIAALVMVLATGCMHRAPEPPRALPVPVSQEPPIVVLAEPSAVARKDEDTASSAVVIFEAAPKSRAAVGVEFRIADTVRFAGAEPVRRDFKGVQFFAQASAIVSSADLRSVSSGVTPNGYPTVRFTLCANGATRMAKASSANLSRSLALLFGDKVLTFARIVYPVSDNIELSGAMTLQQTTELVAEIGSSLPAVRCNGGP
jgi:preprotein translocase subunit SecD